MLRAFSDGSLDSSRVADGETRRDEHAGNPFNLLLAKAAPFFHVVDDGSGLPDLEPPAGQPFLVRGIFSDLKRHDLGPNFHEQPFDGSVVRAFVTELLWGVGTSAPDGHDGRSPTLESVILRHGGEALRARKQFARLSEHTRARLLEFLGSLVLFSPPAAASNLNPGKRAAPDYPLHGHGSIDLSVLFRDPLDKE